MLLLTFLNSLIIILLLIIISGFQFYNERKKKVNQENIYKLTEIISKQKREKRRLLRKLGKEPRENRKEVDIPNPSYICIRAIEEETEALKEQITLKEDETVPKNIKNRLSKIIDSLENLI